MLENSKIIEVIKGVDNSKCSSFEEKYVLPNGTNYSVLYLMDKNERDFTETNNIKYAMFVYQDSNNKDNVIHIVIGQNPSHSSTKNIDGTNQKIYHALMESDEKANRYLLFNTFPIIDADGSNSPSELHVDDNISFF